MLPDAASLLLSLSLSLSRLVRWVGGWMAATAAAQRLQINATKATATLVEETDW